MQGVGCSSRRSQVSNRVEEANIKSTLARPNTTLFLEIHDVCVGFEFTDLSSFN